MADQPVVIVPETPEMATEPAVTIGNIFANKAMVQPAIAAAVGILAGIFKFTADTSDLVDQITTLILFLSFIWGAASAQFEARQRAKSQAITTRDAVYAPATVERIANQQYNAGTPPVAPQPEIPPPGQV